MVRYYLYLSNIFLHIVHISLILLVFMGWWFYETRLISLILIAGTFISWYGLKPFFAKGSKYGYCVITDLHWAVRRRMNLPTPDSGYMKYLSDRLLGDNIESDLIEKITLLLFGVSILGAITTSILLG